MADSPSKTIRLVKGSHTFTFMYTVGDEQAVLDELRAMVARPDMPFDWFDAVILAHQLGKHLGQQLKDYISKGTKDGPC